MKTYSTELVPFRLFDMPCCHHSLCWVNPRLPSYCPACGKAVFAQLKFGDYAVMTRQAILKIQEA